MNTFRRLAAGELRPTFSGRLIARDGRNYSSAAVVCWLAILILAGCQTSRFAPNSPNAPRGYYSNAYPPSEGWSNVDETNPKRGKDQFQIVADQQESNKTYRAKSTETKTQPQNFADGYRASQEDDQNATLLPIRKPARRPPPQLTSSATLLPGSTANKVVGEK